MKENSDKFVLVKFADGSAKKMKAEDVIPLLQAPDVDSIVGISGECGAGGGEMLALLQGLIN